MVVQHSPSHRCTHHEVKHWNIALSSVVISTSTPRRASSVCRLVTSQGWRLRGFIHYRISRLQQIQLISANLLQPCNFYQSPECSHRFFFLIHKPVPQCLIVLPVTLVSCCKDCVVGILNYLRTSLIEKIELMTFFAFWVKIFPSGTQRIKAKVSCGRIKWETLKQFC